MAAFDEKISGVRLYVLMASALGMALTLILTAVREATAMDNITLVAIVGSPFLLALLALRLPRINQQRWIWLGCAVLAALVALPLIFNGVGFFLLAIAAGYAWAFAVTKPRQDSERAPRRR